MREGIEEAISGCDWRARLNGGLEVRGGGRARIFDACSVYK